MTTTNLSAEPGTDQSSATSTGVLLTNLGTPDSPTPRDVRRYLKEFLGDPRVVEAPRALWWLVLNGVILTTRPRRSSAAYAKVWTDNGSPLLHIARLQTTALANALSGEPSSQPIRVELAMRYGKPSLAQGLNRLRQAGVSQLLLLPLYPQYSATTTATTFDAVAAELRNWRDQPELRTIKHYHDAPGYIDALAYSVQQYRLQHGSADRLLMSFHGIPREYVDKGDPYESECQRTASLLADKLQLTDDQWQLSFQSRLGPKEWLQPYTDKTLGQLPADGIKSVQVICPGFSADCLETLEEIAIMNREVFISAGGEKFQYIPCLNDDPNHISMLKNLVLQNIQGWV